MIMNKKVSKISVITTLYKGNKYIEQLQKMIEKNAEILRKQYDIDAVSYTHLTLPTKA